MTRRTTPLVYLDGSDPTAALTIDQAARQVLRGRQPIHLTNHEWRLLAALLDAAGQFVPNITLIQQVWAGEAGRENALHVYIRRLRAKLEPNPASPSLIVGEPGRGYRLATLQPPPLHQPLPPSPLVGRATELAALTTLLCDPTTRLVTLVGLGGVGKTRLALHAAAQLHAEFPGGVLVVELAAITDHALVLPAIMRAAGAREAGVRDPMAALGRALHGRRCLLLLDNYEQLLTAAALPANLLAACPSLTILVTSRAALQLRNERRVALPPLALPPAAHAAGPEALMRYAATELFVQRAQASSPHFTPTEENAEAVAAICRALDGLPLAIELAAARIRLLAPHELLARLSQRLDLLGRNLRDAPARHHTLRHAIDWSYQLLAPREQSLFARLAVFMGGWTLDAAEAIGRDAACTESQLLDDLASLLDHSLIAREPSTGRFSMPETIHAYAQERLASLPDAAAVHRCHAEHMLALAEQAAPALRAAEQVVWLGRSEAEQPNLRAAIGWFVAQGQAEQALRICGAVWWFWGAHGHLGVGRQLCEEALAIAADIAPAVRAGALQAAGGLAQLQGDHAQARDHFSNAIEIYRQQGDQLSVAELENNLGVVAAAQADYAEAARQFAACAERFRALGQPRQLAAALGNQGWVATEQGLPEHALPALEESLALRRRLGDAWGIAASLTNLGWAHLRQGAAVQAAGRFAEGSALWRRLGDDASLAECLEGWATALCEQGQAAAAARLCGHAEHLRARVAAPLPPARQPAYQALRARLVAALGIPAIEAAWAAGRNATIEGLMGGVG